jgi:hypothetical protein
MGVHPFAVNNNNNNNNNNIERGGRERERTNAWVFDC